MLSRSCAGVLRWMEAFNVRFLSDSHSNRFGQKLYIYIFLFNLSTLTDKSTAVPVHTLKPHVA